MEDRYDDYSGVKEFKDVPIGGIFEFESDLTPGTLWYRISDRKYRGYSPGRYEGMECRVSFIHVGVKNVRRGLV